MFLGDLGASKLDEQISNTFRWVLGLLDRLEELSGSKWSEALLLDVVDQMLNGVLGSRDGESAVEDVLDLKL